MAGWGQNWISEKVTCPKSRSSEKWDQGCLTLERWEGEETNRCGRVWLGGKQPEEGGNQCQWEDWSQGGTRDREFCSRHQWTESRNRPPERVGAMGISAQRGGLGNVGCTGSGRRAVFRVSLSGMSPGVSKGRHWNLGALGTWAGKVGPVGSVGGGDDGVSSRFSGGGPKV